jgi:GT2 family glycosyltransferase
LPLLEDHLRRLGLTEPGAELNQEGRIRLQWIPERKLVSIIIPNKDRPGILRRALETLSNKTCYPAYEVILVDNASTDPETLALYRQFTAEPWCRMVQGPVSFNYSAFNNLGARQSRGDYLLFLNNDIEIMDPFWLDDLVMWASRPSVGVVGGQLLYPDGRIQHAGVVLGLVGSAGHVFIGEQPEVQTPFGSPSWYRDCLAVTGACLMTRRDVFETLGGFDEAYQLTFSDITYCLAAIHRGYRVVYNPAARLVHHEGGTRGRHIPIPDLQRMYWDLRQQVTEGDPFYNPLLSHLVGTPTLRRRFEATPASRMDRIQEQLS